MNTKNKLFNLIYVSIILYSIFIIYKNFQFSKNYFSYLKTIQWMIQNTVIPNREATTIIQELSTLTLPVQKNCPNVIHILPEVMDPKKTDFIQVIAFSLLPCEFEIMDQKKILTPLENGHYIVLKTELKGSNLNTNFSIISETQNYKFFVIQK